MIDYQTFSPNRRNPPPALAAAAALDALLAGENPDQSYCRMMRYRLAGATAAECEDTFFIGMDAGRCVSRLWQGWGNHPDAIGNFGNFRTAEAYQRQGIGHQLIARGLADLNSRQQLPLGLFCTASEPHLVRLYGRYGFRPALAGTEGGPLYCPLGNSPSTFREFCDTYYRPAASLHAVPGTVGYRHEIDCLLRFALADAGEPFGLPHMPTYEAAVLQLAFDPSRGRLERLVTDDGHTAGWAFTAPGGARNLQLHPSCRTLPSAE